MLKLIISTKKHKEIIDITELVNEKFQELEISNGLCSLFLTHTSAALTTADLDPGTDLDMLDAFEAIIPKLPYRHPHNPSHVGDHIMSSLIGCSLVIPVKDGGLLLGTWQRVVLIEFDGPRERQIILNYDF